QAASMPVKAPIMIFLVMFFIITPYSNLFPEDPDLGDPDKFQSFRNVDRDAHLLYGVLLELGVCRGTGRHIDERTVQFKYARILLGIEGYLVDVADVLYAVLIFADHLEREGAESVLKHLGVVHHHRAHRAGGL